MPKILRHDPKVPQNRRYTEGLRKLVNRGVISYQEMVEHRGSMSRLRKPRPR